MAGSARVGDRGTEERRDVVASKGSSNVSINGRAALRMGDIGDGTTLMRGAPSVFINNAPAARNGDPVSGPGGAGTLTEGSGTVLIGNRPLLGGTMEPKVHFRLLAADGAPLRGQEVILRDADGQQVYRGTVDSDGYLSNETLPWGIYEVELASGINLKVV